MADFQETIEEARASFVFARHRLQKGLDTTPDDRLTWSPAPTARSVLAVAAHSAFSIGDILDMLQGGVFGPAQPAEADLYHLEREKGVMSREQATALLQQRSDAFLAWLEALTPAGLDSPVTLPFGMGTVPVRVALAFPALHTNNHAGQIDYIQTIYADRTWH